MAPKINYGEHKSDQLVEVFVEDKCVLCEAAIAEEALAHSLGSEEATIGKILAVKSSSGIMTVSLSILEIVILS